MGEALTEWQTYASPREARAAMRRNYDEDRWLGQPYYPALIVEKDTMDPVCRPMAMAWQNAVRVVARLWLADLAA
jgi:hypothetical protein